MIDFISIDISYLGREYIRKHPLLNPELEINIDEKTGEQLKPKFFKPESTATFNNLTFQINKDGRIFLKGSLHKYWNKGIHNHNNFDIYSLKWVLNDLYDKFNIEPKKSIIHHLEFGLNLQNLTYDTNLITDAIMLHCGKGIPAKVFEKEQETGKDYTMVKRDAYKLKLYDKALHQGQYKKILRFECKATKMRELNHIGIKYLNDLIDPIKLDSLKGELIYHWDNVLLDDWTIREEELNPKMKIKLKDWKNPRYWTNKNHFKSRNSFNREIQKYRKVVQEHSSNVHDKIRKALNAQWCKNTTFLQGNEIPEMLQGHTNIIYDLARSPLDTQKETTESNISSELEETIVDQKEGKTLHDKHEKIQTVNKEFIDYCHIGANGEVYIPHPTAKDSFAKYQSKDSYNKRLQFPDYVTREEAEPFFTEIGVINHDLQILKLDELHDLGLKDLSR